MDNNQPNPWQTGQNAGQSATPSWGASANPGGGFNQTSANSASSNTQPTPPSYQPPVSYGAIGNNPTNSNFGQTTSNPTSTNFGGAQFGQQNPQAQPTSPTASTQPSTQSPFQPNAGFQSQPGIANNPVVSAGQLNPNDPMSAQPANPQATPQPAPAKPKQPLSQNQVLFMVTGLVSIIALAVIVICVVLVSGK